MNELIANINNLKTFRKHFQRNQTNLTDIELSYLLSLSSNINVLYFLLENGAKWNETNNNILFSLLKENKFQIFNYLLYNNSYIYPNVINEIYNLIKNKKRNYVRKIKNIFLKNNYYEYNCNWKQFFLTTNFTNYLKFEEVKQNLIKIENRFYELKNNKFDEEFNYEIKQEHNQEYKEENIIDNQELKKIIINNDLEKLKHMNNWTEELFYLIIEYGNLELIKYIVYNVQSFRRYKKNIMIYLARYKKYNILKYFYQNNILPFTYNLLYYCTNNTKVFKYFFKTMKHIWGDKLIKVIQSAIQEKKYNLVYYINKFRPLEHEYIAIDEYEINYITSKLIKQQNFKMLTYLLSKDWPTYYRITDDLYILIENKKKKFVRKINKLLNLDNDYWRKWFLSNDFRNYPKFAHIKEIIKKKENNFYY
jgi:hypothetical protein